jgi:hypothetical protein
MEYLDSNHNLLIRQRSRGMQILNAGNRRIFSEVRLFEFSEKFNKSALQKQPPTHQQKKMPMGLEKGNPLCHILFSMAASESAPSSPEGRPSCFGDEARYVSYLEDQAAGSCCKTCPSEQECGEWILQKCSRELIC